MRFYDIKITDSKTGTEFVRWKTENGTGLHIELQAPVTVLALPSGDTVLRVFNAPWQYHTNIVEMEGMNIEIYGGMKKGLPLANPDQYGLLLQGEIFRCFGDLEGKTNILQFVVIPSGSRDVKENIIFHIKAGQKLGDAITEALVSAGYNRDTIISKLDKTLVQNYDEPHFSAHLREFGGWIKLRYDIDIVNQNKRFLLFDKKQPATNEVKISVNDLIGQPTWLKAAESEISIKTVLRGDILVGDTKIIINQPMIARASAIGSAGLSIKNRLSFTGTFICTGITHFAEYCNKDAGSWASVITLKATT
jgi:hypothetical protein